MEKYGKEFKELTAKEKTEHIWEYYRWHIFGTIIGVILIASLVVTMLRPQKQFTVDVMIAGKVIRDDTQPEVIQRFEEEFDTSLNIASVDFTHMGEMELVMMQKIPLLIRSNELDILVLSKDAFMSYLIQGGGAMFAPLDDIPEMQFLLERKKDSLISSGNIDVSKLDEEMRQSAEKIIAEDHVYGIRLTEIPNVPSLQLTEELVAGVTVTAKDIQKTAEMLDYLTP